METLVEGRRDSSTDLCTASSTTGPKPQSRESTHSNSTSLAMPPSDLTFGISQDRIASEGSIQCTRGKLFWRQAAGAIVAWDITNQETLENAVRWKEQLDEYWDSKCRNVFPVVLVANKYDLIRNFEEEGKEIDDYMQQE